MLGPRFYNRDTQIVAKDLLGKIICRKYQGQRLCVQIIETEAYYLNEKASHASLGYTEKRKALFMSAGTIYMYYSRAGDSLNVSTEGEGNAVLIKSAIPYTGILDQEAADNMFAIMHQLNPHKQVGKKREDIRLCSGQTLLCKSLHLKVPEWDAKQFDSQQFYIKDAGYRPEKIIQTARLGIPKGRDEHLMYRFVDAYHAAFFIKNPLKC